MRKRLLPGHIEGTAEEWRRRKRREFYAIIKAFEVYRTGSAYAPVKCAEISRLLHEGWEQLRGNWKP